MKRLLFLGLALILAGLVLAGCIGGGNPTDSHATTTTTTTTRSATNTMTTDATQTQTNNRTVCVGLVNVASCNVVQSASPKAGDPAQQEGASGGSGVPLAQSAGVLCSGAPIVLLFVALAVFGLLFAGKGR